MTRSLRVAVCAASLLLVAAGSANAQTAETIPTTPATTAATDFTLPAACKPADATTSTFETHGEQMRACIRALRAAFAGDDDHHGPGQWISALARESRQGRHAGDSDDAADVTTSDATSVDSTSAASPAATAPSTTAEHVAPAAHADRPRSHEHADD